MSVIDGVLLAVLVLFAFVGWRQGFVAGVFSFIGFLGGGALTIIFIPELVEQWISSTTVRLVVLLVAIVLGAVIGQAFMSFLGQRLRAFISWSPVRFVDSLAGAGLNVAAFVVMLWVVASALAYAPFPVVSDQLSGSRVITTLDGAVPDAARDALFNVTGAIGETAIPTIVAEAGNLVAPQVDEPDGAVVSPALDEARESVVKIVGDATECNSIVSGSGFVMSQGLIATNAHVVAGAKDLRVRVRSGIASASADVVYFDPDTDIAFLRASELVAPPLDLVLTVLDRGESVVIAGFPGGGRFEATAARIRDVVTSRGETIYGEPGGQREVYVVRGTTHPGNSGGPLLTEGGRVAGMIFAAAAEDAESTYALPGPLIAEARAVAGDAMEAVANGSCNIRVKP